MSILAEVTPTTVPVLPEEDLFLTAAMLMIGLALAALVAWFMGVFRRDNIRGPVRVGRKVPLGSLIIVTAVGGTIWFMAQAAFLGIRSAQYRQNHPGQEFGLDKLSATDFALLATVPFLIGIVALLLGDATVRRDIPWRLGLALATLPRGLAIALASMFIVMPVMIACSVFLEWLYRVIGYEHPTEHQMLKAMTDAPQYARVLLAIGACALAPAFEELFFRGHIQTVLIRLFRGMAASRWLAVIVTSVLFTIFHEPWSWPVIFLLAVCLGYAYERTGNLWTPLFIHAFFNTFQTLIFLNMR